MTLKLSLVAEVEVAVLMGEGQALEVPAPLREEEASVLLLGSLGQKA